MTDGTRLGGALIIGALPGVGDTIAAAATPPGRSAVAVVRVSGPAVVPIGGAIVRPWRPEPRQSYLAGLHDPVTGELLDRGIVTFHPGPRSYTGEDLLELSVHGGLMAPTLVLRAVFAAGARLAMPGEFTRRAVLNGRLDLLQAEATGDLIDSSSTAMHRGALAQLSGTLTRRIESLRDYILELEALVAYDIDFPEEDQGPLAHERVLTAVTRLSRLLDELLATGRTGELIRQGAVVVIAGAPNVGKSSLFNALVGAARAIVTDMPGTTRDALEAVIEVGGWPVRLVDTAGLRDSAELVERLGIEVSERYVREADLVLACGDSDGALEASLAALRLLTDVPLQPVRTKADIAAPRSAVTEDGIRILATSMATGEGLAELGEVICSRLMAAYGTHPAGHVPMLTRERHRAAVARARAEVEGFVGAWACEQLPTPVAAVHLRAAAGALEDLVGTVSVEDVLDRLFATFCVGK